MNVRMWASIISFAGILGLMIFRYALQHSGDNRPERTPEEEVQRKEKAQDELLKMGITKEMLDLNKKSGEEVSVETQDRLSKHDMDVLKKIIAVQSKYHAAKGRLTYAISYPEEPDRLPERYDCLLKIQVPNKYKITLRKDEHDQSYISDGKTEWYVEDIDGSLFSSDKKIDGGGGKLSVLTDYIPLRVESLQQDFILCASKLPEEDHLKSKVYELLLLPRSKDRSDHMRWIRLYFDDLCNLTEMKMEDGQKNRYDIGVREMEYNLEFAEDIFSYSEKE